LKIEVKLDMRRFTTGEVGEEGARPVHVAKSRRDRDAPFLSGS
jgi:hypothetical protein